MTPEPTTTNPEANDERSAFDTGSNPGVSATDSSSETASDASDDAGTSGGGDASARTEPVARQVYPKVDGATQRHLVDAIVGDVLRTVKASKPDPKTVALLQKIAADAVKLQLWLRSADTSVPSVKKSGERKLAQLTAQIESVKVAGRVLALKTFWSSVEKVVARLAQFALVVVTKA